MTLNGEMVFILRYFTEFGSFRGALHKSGCQSHKYEQFTITMSSVKRLQRDRATPPVQSGNSVANSYIPRLMRSTCLAIV